MSREMICKAGSFFFRGWSPGASKGSRPKIPRSPGRILLFRMGAIGDVLMTTPAVRLVRKKYPLAKISFLVGEWSRLALEKNPDIDEIITFDDRIVFERRISKLLDLIRRIRARRFDMCINFERDYRFNLLAYMFRIPVRIGFDRNGEGFPNTHNIPYIGRRYELDYNLEVARVLRSKVSSRKMHLNLDREVRDRAQSFIADNRIRGPIVGIAPGGARNLGDEFAAKRWPVESYIELVRRLASSYAVILFGGPGDAEVCSKIVDGSGSRNVYDASGKMTIREAAALMARCSAFVTHDSGPMHIAAAGGTRVVALFGPTPSRRFAPKGAVVLEVKRKGCPCYDLYGNYKKRCRKECIGGIPVEDVFGAVQRVLRSSG